MSSEQLCVVVEGTGRDAEAAASGTAGRARELVSQMTIDEKLSLVISYFPLISPRANELGMTMASGHTEGVPRLGVPTLRISDASLGVANVLDARAGDTATALPSSLAIGASFDRTLAFSGGAMIGSEARAKGFNVMLVGGINLTRDPWAGRNFEYIGEDPLLTGVLGGASVAGVQSNNIAATVKHLALNSQETGRMIADARMDPVDLRESDLLAFEIALELGKPASVMTCYNKVNGEWGGENAVLINDILKGEWRFPGWVMSDWGAVHSTEKAALAGLDQESGLELDERLNGAIFFTDRLRDAVDAGRVPMARLDDMAGRIVGAMIAVGAFDNPPPSTPQPVDTGSNGDVAQRVAEAGSVLLRNEGAILPLPGDISSIAVIGGRADVGVPSGGGSSQVRSVGGVTYERSLDSGDASWFCRETYHCSSPLEALRDRAPGADIGFADGSDIAAASALAGKSDVAIIFATQWQTEAVDALTLALPDGQDELISKVAAANPRTVIVLETGGPVLMPWLADVSAVLQAWYPGQRGGEAIARLLFGDVNPSGRLPVSFPASDDQAPRTEPGGLEQLRARDAAVAAGDRSARIGPFTVDYVEGANAGYRWYDVMGRKPLFPFGYGLSYTRFEYANLAIVDHGARPRVRLDVTNVGERDGADVQQIYVRAADRMGRESWRLAGFARSEIAAGSTIQIEIDLDPRTFSNWDDGAKLWRRSTKALDLAAGRSSGDLVLFDTLSGTVAE